MKTLILSIFVSGILFGQVTRGRFSDTLELSNYQSISADSLFRFSISQLTFLDYNDCNNCALRAHVMCFAFSKIYPGVNLAKVWLFADSKLSSRRSYYMTHTKEYLSGIDGCPHWGFHVAPMIIADNDTIVIDPSTQNTPVKIEKWVNDISTNTSSFTVIKKFIYYSYPEDKYNLFDDGKSEWDLKYDFSSLDTEIKFIAQKLTMAYCSNMFDPIRFYNYKNMISKIISLKPN